MATFHDLAVELDRAATPGAMETYLSRLIPGGLIEFEQAPTGWLKKDGEPRRTDWRAYFWTPNSGKRVRVPSVTTILDGILPKPGLPPWAEARGIEGAVEAVRLGEIDAADPASAAQAVETVRRLRLGADRARDDAADRGINVHDLLRAYMETGAAPRPDGHPVEHHGYIRGLTAWLRATDAEPIAVEELVCSPEHDYAGRYDLAAKIYGRVEIIDAKTQARAGIFEAAHIQVALYRLAAAHSGDGEVDGTRVVVFAEDGAFREMAGQGNPELVAAALTFARLLKPVTSICERHNRAERKARAA